MTDTPEAKNKNKTVDDWLDEVDYASLNNGKYVPSAFALSFMNFIQMVNGEEGESHKTPVVHLKMLDKIAGKKQRIANLCFRGASKTTLMFEYFAPYVAIFGGVEGFGDVSGMIYVSDSMDNGVKSARKNIEYRYNNSEMLQYFLPQAIFTDKSIEFTNREGKTLGIKMFGAKTGLRGTKIAGKRPTIAVLDDLVSDDDSKSKVSMEAIKDTIYKGVNFALDPNKRKIIFNGTPFNKTDILYEAVESGEWDVNVWPVCEEFPCSREEFNGAWPDRFGYDFVKSEYDFAKNSGKIAAFYQELMLRISSEEERLVQESEIKKYSRKDLMKYRSRFNFYITTDFATSDSETADYSVISVWAYNANGDWFWVDGVIARQTMDLSINDLFRLVQEYRPQSVGVEVTGQQNAFIQWLQREMMERNIWFNFAMEKGKAGIRPTMNKLSRFNLVVPLFKAGKIYFPEEMDDSKIMELAMSQLRLATVNGLKGKDDFLDTVSMLMYMNPWKPSEETNMISEDGKYYVDDDDDDDEGLGISSYIV